MIFLSAKKEREENNQYPRLMKCVPFPNGKYRLEALMIRICTVGALKSGFSPELEIPEGSSDSQHPVFTGKFTDKERLVVI